MEEIFFYAKNERYGEFSNFSHHGIEMDGLWWPTVEHYFQAQKFEDTSYQEKIRTSSSAKIAAELGRSRKVQIKTNWDAVKRSIMKDAVLKKFQTHDKLKDLLLTTKNLRIVEGSINDYYWGCGQDGSGKNELGKILMEVREILNNKE